MRSAATVAAALVVAAAPLLAADPLVVHEWGTFTSLQDELGHTVGGINTDDEPVPGFVHTVRSGLLLWPTDLPNSYFVKGYPRLHPDVTMRLETPVMYFYPPDERTRELTVRASFRGGWLTEYYPKAQVEAPGLARQLPDGQTAIGGIDAGTVGSLTWTDLRVGVSANVPQTDAEVWLAPRRVRAASLAMPDGESEKYLFYRGVGHLDAPLHVVRAGDRLEVRSEGVDPRFAGLVVGDAWLADIRDDGTCAFRPLGALTLSGRPVTVPSGFAPADYAAGNLDGLRADMRRGLVAEGLFADEADAMLDTWRAAYFQSVGLRLFYTVPQAWTDHYLPLDFSQAVDLTRVMVGRVELVTPRQRDLLARIASTPPEPFPLSRVNDVMRLEHAGDDGFYRDLVAGRTSVADLGVDLPATFLAYRDLGRLRNALVLHELAVRPTPDLRAFVAAYALAGYDPSAVSDAGSATAVLADGADGAPPSFVLEQNVPNPFNPETALRFILPGPQHVHLAVYDLADQVVSTLADADLPAGDHSLIWGGRGDDGRAVAAGVYLYQLQTPAATQTRKLLLLK